jgi:adenosylcobinamide-GDP ribazoletransferase
MTSSASPSDPPPGLFDGPRAALALLTRLPAGDSPIGARGLRRAPSFFPLIGLLIGALVGGTLGLLRPHVGSPLAVLLALVVGVLVTGALHEDGLADTADARGGAGGDRQRLFAILKDSRHGTYGVLALVLSVAARWACLDRLGLAAPGALLLTAALSRTFLVWMMARMPYVTPAATAISGAAARATTRQAIAATVVAVLIFAGLLAAGLVQPASASGATAAGIGVALWLARRFRTLAGGITGDFLGATQQLTEIVMLVVLVALG